MPCRFAVLKGVHADNLVVPEEVVMARRQQQQAMQQQIQQEQDAEMDKAAISSPTTAKVVEAELEQNQQQ